MKDKNNVVVAVGLIIIFCIVISVAWSNAEFTSLSLKSANSVDSLTTWQKDMQIKKLADQLKAKQAELDGLKAKLAGVKDIVS